MDSPYRSPPRPRAGWLRRRIYRKPDINGITGHSMRRLDVIVGLVAAIGVAIVVVRPGAEIDPIGVAAALSSERIILHRRRATKTLPTPADRVTATGWQLLLPTVIIAPVAWIIEGPPPAITWTNVLGFAYLSLVAIGVAFVAWYNAIRLLPTQASPVLGLAGPLTGAALGWVLLNEDLTALQMLGFAVTISAIVHAATRGSTPPSATGRSSTVAAAPPERLPNASPI